MKEASTSPDKITILRMSAIGDALMLLPAIRLLKKQFPNTQIDWLIDRPIASLFAEVSEVNIVAIDKPRSFKDYWQFKKNWSNKNVGQLISLQTSMVSNLVMGLLSADHKTGFGRPYSREGHRFFTNTAYDLKPKLHQVEIFHALVEHFSGLDDNGMIANKDLILPLNNNDILWGKEKLKTHSKWVAINPMASTQEKTWLESHYVNLIKSLGMEYPEYQIVLTGGPSAQEIQFSQSIQSQLSKPCLNLVGQTSLTQLAAILKQVNLVISPDTGPLHLANAVATPVIGLYAVTRPEYIGPYNQLQNCIDFYAQTAQKVLHKTAEQLPWQKKISSLDAMSSISVEHVLNKVHQQKL